MNVPQAETRRNHPFTLIELLVVIAIIAVLMGLLFPAIGLVKNNAKITKAKSEMNSIVLAIKSYESTYGILPWTSSVSPIKDSCSVASSHADTTNDITYNTLIGILTGTNARKMIFLDPRATGSTYTDPWGIDYIILLDVNYDGKIRLPEDVVAKQKTYGTSVADSLNGSVFVYCYGNDKVIGGSNDIVSWE